jgi:hypothetical protein
MKPLHERFRKDFKMISEPLHDFWMELGLLRDHMISRNGGKELSQSDDDYLFINLIRYKFGKDPLPRKPTVENMKYKREKAKERLEKVVEK